MFGEVRDEGSGAARLLAAADAGAWGLRERAQAAIADSFTADPLRQTERQRAVVARLLERVIGDIEIELRARIAAALPIEALGDEFVAANLPLAEPMLRRRGLLADPELFALLIARAEEHRIATDMRLRALGEGAAPGSPIESADPDTARAEMALVIAESRRFDRIDEPELSHADLPAELLERLAWAVAAALRHYLISGRGLGATEAGEAVAGAVVELLGEHDEGMSLDAAAHRLARRLHAGGGIDDGRLRAALDAGRLALFVALLSVRTGLDPAAGHELALDPSGPRLAVLLRAAGIERSAAVSMLVDIVVLDDAALSALVDDYDALPVADAIEALKPWRLAAGYRRAVAAFEEGRR